MSLSFKLRGTLIKKDEVEKVISETFKKRSFTVEVVNNNPASLSYSQKDNYNFDISNNNCQQLDEFSVGDDVEVLFNIKCKEYKKEDSQESRVFTTLHAWRIQKPQNNTFSNPGNNNRNNNSRTDSEDSEDNFKNIEEKDDLPF